MWKYIYNRIHSFWRYSLIGKIVDSYFTVIGSSPIVSSLKGWSRGIYQPSVKAVGNYYYNFYNYQAVLFLNPIIVEGFSDSNINEYYEFLFWGLWKIAVVVIPLVLIDDYLMDKEKILLANFDGTKPTSLKWWKPTNFDSYCPVNTWTNSLELKYGILWVKVVAPVHGTTNVKGLLDLPASLATDGVLIEIISGLAAKDYFTVILYTNRLLMLYFSGYKHLATKEDLIFFFQTASVNFSLETKLYLSKWAQGILGLHFNKKYSDCAYLPLDYKNPVVEFAQLWVLTYDLPFLEN